MYVVVNSMVKLFSPNFENRFIFNLLSKILEITNISIKNVNKRIYVCHVSVVFCKLWCINKSKNV